MLVTFISECEKKALNRTRRVLDAFANRIGNNTWQTPITQEGLDAVKKLLKQSATKNTAVSCHQFKSRVRTEMLWIVGNRNKFNNEGIVAVNWTKQDKFIGEFEIENIRLIRALAVLAALFHDFGKSSNAFQEKLRDNKKTDALRHEWVSVLFISAFANGKTDKDWLEDLQKENIDKAFKELDISAIKNPLKDLPDSASIIAWLVLSHHRLPSMRAYENNSLNKEEIFKLINSKWNDDKKSSENLQDCFTFNNGLLSDSQKWRKEVKRWSRKLQEELLSLEKSLENNSYRLILNYARTCFMLGDYHFSSQDKEKYNSEIKYLYANTDKNGLKQYLDEHILGVTRQAKNNVDNLLEFENIKHAFDNNALKKASPAEFKWQDLVVKKIKNWRDKQKIDNKQFGFFAVNIASTGKGKTFANAKIMRALSPRMDSLRYILALGLRTLTLQTGREYREKIGLNNSDLAVLIGSEAILKLDEKNNTGSESEQEMQNITLDNDKTVNFDKELPKGLGAILKNKKYKQLLHSPVLSCTIDHIIGVTETTRGGKYILPFLRLMSSDLVIDEVDDFDGNDLIAIGRLIHHTGMLGRKVMISSATIPPDLALGFFYAYKSGWEIFAKMRNKNSEVGCLWVDEFNAQVKTAKDYEKQHNNFIKDRIKELESEEAKRKVNIVTIAKNSNIDDYFLAIQKEAVIKHKHHSFIDDKTGIKISIGIVRMANVKPCINLTKYLLNSKIKNTTIITMAYHSRQVLLMRSEQERYLDKILKNRKDSSKILVDEVIRGHIDKSSNKNIIFILVATPVAEVGRDHDFDWAIIEPSSYRSFIQLAGRVLRHRSIQITQPNIAIMQYNLKFLNGEKIIFDKPGYESKRNKLDTHNLQELINTIELGQKLDATKRIQKSENLDHKNNLADLEHYVIKQLLTSDIVGAGTLKSWCESDWWLTGVPQEYVRFRDNSNDEIAFLTEYEEFKKKDNSNRLIKAYKDNITIAELIKDEYNNLWLIRDYEELLKQQQKGEESLEKVIMAYGEINLPYYNSTGNNKYIYYHQLGLFKS